MFGNFPKFVVESFLQILNLLKYNLQVLFDELSKTPQNPFQGLLYHLPHKHTAIL